MKLLWEVQMKQLSVRSPKGYHCHTRLFVKFQLNSTFVGFLIGLQVIYKGHISSRQGLEARAITLGKTCISVTNPFVNLYLLSDFYEE